MSTVTAPPRRRPGVSADHEHYRWWALSCTSLGMLLAATNSGTLIIALPDLERSLHTTLLELVWVILAYMIASTVLVLSFGRLSDLFGRKRAYVARLPHLRRRPRSAPGFAGSGTQLILWRIFQGIGAAFLFANAPALVTDAFPREQLGLAMGANTMVAAIGLVLGPVLGGALVAISWHWVFWFNVPFALAGAAWGASSCASWSSPTRCAAIDLLGTPRSSSGSPGSCSASRGAASTAGTTRSSSAGLAAAAVFLPMWVWIENHVDARRCSTSGCSATGCSRRPRRRLPQRPRPLRADVPVRLLLPGAPRATTRSPPASSSSRSPLGMLIASPLAGSYADRHGSRGLAALGMVVTGVGLALMTTLQVHTAYWQSALWLLIVGVGSGMFNSPNTAAMMGAVPAQRRGVAAGARTLVQNSGAVMSIAFVLAIVTSAVPKPTLFRIFSGLSQGLSDAKLAPFIHNMHVALWVLAATSFLGAAVCLLRPKHVVAEDARRGRRGDRAAARERDGGIAMSDTTPDLRIGDVARLAGTTPRTIRYYEEIGLLERGAQRASGSHRLYSEHDVERLREVIRLRELLNVSLEELKTLLAAEEARAQLRSELSREDVDARAAPRCCCGRRSDTSSSSSPSCGAAARSWPSSSRTSPRNADGSNDACASCRPPRPPGPTPRRPRRWRPAPAVPRRPAPHSGRRALGFPVDRQCVRIRVWHDAGAFAIRASATPDRLAASVSGGARTRRTPSMPDFSPSAASQQRS